jgi:hypothetical protein
MAREKKDAKYLNVHIEYSLYERFDAFCKKYGYTKTGAVERAIASFMDEINRKMNEAEVQRDGTAK